MQDNFIDYARFVDEAMRDVVRKALDVAQDNKLPGEHHFYITFRTNHEDCSLPQAVLNRYPQEMTIVLQHQFWDLIPGEYGFSVSLSFDGKPSNLYIPYNALISFADPSVNFGLQFHVIEEDDEDLDHFHEQSADNDATNSDADDINDDDASILTLTSSPQKVKSSKKTTTKKSLAKKTNIKKTSSKKPTLKSNVKSAKKDDTKSLQQTNNVVSLTDFRKKQDPKS